MTLNEFRAIDAAVDAIVHRGTSLIETLKQAINNGIIPNATVVLSGPSFVQMKYFGLSINFRIEIIANTEAINGRIRITYFDFGQPATEHEVPVRFAFDASGPIYGDGGQ